MDMATKKVKVKKTKTVTRTSSQTNLVRLCAYIALLIAATLFLVNGLLGLLEVAGMGKLISVLGFIGKVCLAVGIVFPAYDYTCGKKRIWRVLFWVAVAVYLLGCVFGVI